jgi:multisubunit Na+/H+ antiporter MnhC subunit
MNDLILIGMLVMVIEKQKLDLLLCIALLSSISKLTRLYINKDIGLFILCIIVIGMALTCIIAKSQSGYIEEIQEESQEESYVE